MRLLRLPFGIADHGVRVLIEWVHMHHSSPSWLSLEKRAEVQAGGRSTEKPTIFRFDL